MATKAKKRTKKADEDQLMFELTPLPPDTYEKPTIWATPDGLAPALTHCKVRGCPEWTSNPPLCDPHRAEFSKRMKDRIIVKVNEASNGR